MSGHTIEELKAQIAAAQLEIDRQMLTPLIKIVEAFSDPAIQNAIDVAQENFEFCSGEAAQQVSNLLVVNRNSVEFLKQHAIQLDARINGPIPTESQGTTPQTTTTEPAPAA